MNKSHPFVVLRFRSYRLIYLGQFISRVGSEMQYVAIMWHLYYLTHSAASLGLVGLARFLPAMVMMPIAGMAADIYSKKKLMIWSQLIMMTVTCILSFTTWIGKASPLLIYIILGLTAAAQSFDTPARQSLVPSLVPKKYLVEAASFGGMMWQLGALIGPAMAGFMIAAFGVGTVYFLNAISFLAILYGVTAAEIQLTPNILKATMSLKTLKEGATFILHTPILFSAMVLDFIATFFASASTLLPVFVDSVFHKGPRELGFLYAAPAMGALLGSFVIPVIKHKGNQGKIIFVVVTLYGVATALFGLNKEYYLALLLLFLIGMFDMISVVIRSTIRLLSTPDHLRGRVIGTNTFFASSGTQLGEVEAGFTAHIWGAGTSTFIGGAAAAFLTLVVAVFASKLRNYNIPQESSE